MAWYEYMRLLINIIPQYIIDEYQLMNELKNGFIMCEILRGMYGLPQAEMIANKLLTDRLAKHGYRPCERTSGLWNNGTIMVTFFLTVNDIGIKYVGK